MYTITIVQTEANGRKIKSKKRMKLVGKYKYHAQFESDKGIRQSFTYWELQRIIAKDSVKKK